MPDRLGAPLHQAMERTAEFVSVEEENKFVLLYQIIKVTAS